MIQEKYLENCLRQKDSEYKDLKSYQPMRASVVELIEVKLNMEVGDWWNEEESDRDIELAVGSRTTVFEKATWVYIIKGLEY